MDELLNYTNLFMLVFARLGGMIFANPLFSRRNVPMRVRAGLVLAISILLVPAMSGAAVNSYNAVEMMGAMLKEAAFGICFGLIFQIFYYMLFVAGDLLDTVFGFAMSRVFDPINGLQVSLSGQLLQIIFVVYFFATGSHLIMVKLFSYSFEMIPAGEFTLNLDAVSGFILTLFSSAFLLVMKLSLPFVAAEFLVEAAMGILMKLIPQIHVFVINMQCKILAGLLLMMLFAEPVGNFIDNYIKVLFDEMQKLLTMVA